MDCLPVLLQFQLLVGLEPTALPGREPEVLLALLLQYPPELDLLLVRIQLP